MKENIFEIKHIKFGNEGFEITDAKYNLCKTKNNIWEFTVSFNTNVALKRAKEFEENIDIKPHFEATAILPADDLDLEVGKIISQKEGYDNDTDEYLSNIYYFEHNSVEDFEFEIIQIEQDWIIANVKGKAIINSSNGHEPDAELVIENTKFYLDKKLRRGII